MTDAHEFVDPPSDRGGTLNRRTLLMRAASLGVSATALPAVLAACGGSASSPVTSRSSGTGGGPASSWGGQPVTRPYGLSSDGSPKRGGALEWAYQYQPPPQLDPQLPTNATNADFNILLNIYDQLTNLVPGQMRNGPGLAEHWEIDKAGLNYTFFLRDAEFSNGDAVTGDDVAFSINRFANPKINGQLAFLASAVKEVKALNAKTVRITLKNPQAMFLDVMGHATASIVPQRVVEKMGKAFGQKPIGSGAFTLQSLNPGQAITLGRNPNYRKPGQPYVDSVTYKYVPDDNARMLQVTSNQSNIGFPVPYALLGQYQNDPGFRLQMEPYANIVNAVFNLHVHPFDEINVRLALGYATPRQQIVQSVLRNAAIVANTALGRTEFWDPSQPVIPYDIGKAKSLLASSSVPNGFSSNLLILGTDSDSNSMATILQAAWGQIGVKLNIQTADYNTVLARVYSQTPNYDIVLFPPDYASSDIGDDDELALFNYVPLQVDFGGFFYDVPTVTRLVEQAGSTLDQSLRRSIFQRLQRYCYAVNPCDLAIALGCSRTLVNAKVQGLQTQLDNTWRLENVWINGAAGS